MATDLSADIETIAASPQSTSVDGHSTSERPLESVIKADQYLAGVTARSRRRRGIAYTKNINAGPISDRGGTVGGATFDGGPS